MRYEVTSIEGHQTAKVVACIAAVFSLIFAAIGVILTIISFLLPSEARWSMFGMGVMYILAPVFYIIIMYLWMRIGCWLYNLISRRTGGVRFTIIEHPVQPGQDHIQANPVST